MSLSPVQHLRNPRARWVDLEVQLSATQEGMRVESRHTSHTGRVLQHFITPWRDPQRLASEYAHGLSIVHDVKDHIFHGLGLTPLTEIQTIVQTYYGREVSGGKTGLAPDGDVLSVIREHVFHELYGLAGRPLVYDLSPQSQQGTLDMYAAWAGEQEREEAFVHLCTICEDIMLPPLREAYARNELTRRLQASARDQPELVEELLGGLRWADRPNLLMRLADNLGFHTRIRAYIDEELAAATEQILDGIRAYLREHPQLERYGRIFDLTDYTLP